MLAILNDRIADGRDVSWVWDADVETLAPRIGRLTCSGTRAAELALRFKYAGVPAERIAVDPDLGAALDGALARARGRLYALPTYTAMLALRRLLARRGQAPSSWARGMSAEAVIWHDLECGGYRADLPLLAGARGRATAARCSTSAPAPAASRSARARRPRGDRARARRARWRPSCAPRRAVCRSRSAARMPARSRCAAPVPLCIVPMQTMHLLADRAAFLRCARAALRPGGILAVALLGSGVEPFELELEPDAVRSTASATRARRRRCGAWRRDGAAVRARAPPLAPRWTAPARSELDRVTLRDCDARRARPPRRRAFGFVPAGVDAIAPTLEHAGSEIVCLAAAS